MVKQQYYKAVLSAGDDTTDAEQWTRGRNSDRNLDDTDQDLRDDRYVAGGDIGPCLFSSGLENGRQKGELPNHPRMKLSKRFLHRLNWATLISVVGWLLVFNYIGAIVRIGEPSLLPTFISNECTNPYDLRGVLMVNTSSPEENKWEPIDRTCSPLDYLHLLRTRDTTGALEFAVNKSIVLFGDSVDRLHLIDTCAFASGRLEQIKPSHSASPPYPLGQEIPPEGYVNPIDGTRTWPVFDHSTPFLCTVDSYNLRILSVFHYGLQEELDDEMKMHPHFYPPHKLEDRFHEIVLPILSSLEMSPSIISITQGFWTILRYGLVDRGVREALLQNGHDAQATTLKSLGDWLDLSAGRREEIHRRVREILETLIDWRSRQNRKHAIRILFRELHHPKFQDNLPHHRVQAANQIGLEVVESLWKEDDSIISMRRGRSQNLRHNLIVNHWGSLILGQEHNFVDNVHPKPLPGNYLYGNMLLHQLKLAAT